MLFRESGHCEGVQRRTPSTVVFLGGAGHYLCKRGAPERFLHTQAPSTALRSPFLPEEGFLLVNAEGGLARYEVPRLAEIASG